MFKQWLTTVSIGAVLLGFAGVQAQTPPLVLCDRTCMIGMVDRYLAAIVKHDASGLPLAKEVRFTDNTAEINIGDGLWVGASEAPTTFKIYAVDTAARQVAFYGVMREWDKPLIIALRLKVINGKFTEVQHVLARNLRADRMESLITGVPGVDTIPMSGVTSNLQAAEILKIRRGQLHEIEAMGVSLPYGTKSGWE